MNPCILHHTVVRATIGVKYPLQFFVCCCMFTPLHSSMNQELFEKYVSNQSSHYENTMVLCAPVIVWKYPLPFSVSYVQLITQQYKSRSVWKAPLY